MYVATAEVTWLIFFDVELEMAQEVSRTQTEGIAAMIFLIVPRLQSPLVLIESSRQKAMIKRILHCLNPQYTLFRYPPRQSPQGQAHNILIQLFRFDQVQQQLLTIQP